MSCVLLKGVIRNGRVEIDEPIDLPDGTEVLVTAGAATEDHDDAWDNSPDAIAAIAAWLTWCDGLQPLKITPEEEADADDWLKKINHHGMAKMEDGIEDLFR